MSISPPIQLALDFSSLRRCTNCKSLLQTTQFHKKKHSKDGLQQSCIDCRKEAWKRCKARFGGKTNPETLERIRWIHIQQTYGLTKEEYEALVTAQDYQCAVCGIDPRPKNFHVDHDHATGKIRGLLCHSCNVGLGHLKDDILLLRQAIAYLQQYQE